MAKKSLNQRRKKYIFLWYANISNTSFDKRSPRPREQDVLNYHRHTYRQTKMATLWLNQTSEADSVKIKFSTAKLFEEYQMVLLSDRLGFFCLLAVNGWLVPIGKDCLIKFVLNCTALYFIVLHCTALYFILQKQEGEGGAEGQAGRQNHSLGLDEEERGHNRCQRFRHQGQQAIAGPS